MTSDDLVALIKKRPLAFVGALVAVLCAVALYFRLDAVEVAQAAFEEKEKEALRVDLNVRYLAGLAEQTVEIQKAASEFETRLIRAQQLANNLQFFYRIEAETGVKLIDVRQNAIPPSTRGAPRGAYSPIPYSVSALGSFDQAHKFLRRVEEGPHFVRINQVTFSKTEAGRGEMGGGGGANEGMSITILLELLGTP
ncbi:MAG: hypothetical protein Q8J74_12980 [Candidatus Didemnitutus sp.]|nr:hypothetical protein [Candidatus Didemnitutus sp.]